MGDLAGRTAVGHGDGGRARQEMQGTDARKSTTVVYDSFVGAQVKGMATVGHGSLPAAALRAEQTGKRASGRASRRASGRAERVEQAKQAAAAPLRAF
ncbi:hypothetical protein R1flu_017508 [Riccia fluitans]|uniref:Uncharacterized protein n=1 Tax=Riccia fluitans TaxID=41844 RepID=A0ABD1ZD57_9MARC